MEDYEGMESDCCCAKIINHDMCSECKEHCQPMPGDDSETNASAEMTKEEFVKEIGLIYEISMSVKDCHGSMKHLFGPSALAESVFICVIYRAMDLAIKYLAERVGDNSGWIDWFVYECELGDKPMYVVIDGVRSDCCCAEDLFDIINNK